MRLKLLFLTFIPFLSLAQFDPKMEEYQHKVIFTKSDTINYHIYSKGKIKDFINYQNRWDLRTPIFANEIFDLLVLFDQF